MLDVVIPTCSRDVEQVSILLRSLEARVDLAALGSICLVSVDDPDFYAQMRTLSTPGLQSRLVYLRPEDLGVPGVQAGHSGWLIQQLVKLAFARHASSPFYLVFDSKNVVLAPVRSEHLVRDGRAAWTLEDVGLHPRWWRGCARLLEHPTFERRPPRLALSAATPVILHAATVTQMVDWVERRYARPFAQTFLRGGILGPFSRPTEFCLYYTYLDRQRELDNYHMRVRWFHDVEVQVWNSQPPAVQRQRILRLLEEEPAGLFTGIHAAAWRSLDPELRRRVTEAVTRPVEEPRVQLMH